MSRKIISFKGLKPRLCEDVFIASGAKIVGDVEIGEKSSIWFNCTLRGDVAPIKIGKNTNIQDGAVIHTSRFGEGSTVIGDNVTVGHLVLLHACKVKDNAFIGMQSTVMDGVTVEEYGFVGAGSLVTPGKKIGKRELWIGRPAIFSRLITEEEADFMRDNIRNYLELASYYKLDLPQGQG